MSAALPHDYGAACRHKRGCKIGRLKHNTARCNRIAVMADPARARAPRVPTQAREVPLPPARLVARRRII